MQTRPTRTYRSAVRERQAGETRQSIADAAERLLLARGYAKMTVEAVAREAGVAPQTVYAVFGSKVGILGELINRLVFFEGHDSLFKKAMRETDPHQSLRCLVRLARQIFEAVAPLCDLLRSPGVLDPELADLANQHEQQRRLKMEPYIQRLYQAGYLRPELDPQSALDVFWSLTTWEPYQLLVEQCGWSTERYEAWMFELLSFALFGDRKKRQAEQVGNAGRGRSAKPKKRTSLAGNSDSVGL